MRNLSKAIVVLALLAMCAPTSAATTFNYQRPSGYSYSVSCLNEGGLVCAARRARPVRRLAVAVVKAQPVRKVVRAALRAPVAVLRGTARLVRGAGRAAFGPRACCR